MAENTHSQASLCEMEERLSSRMESRFVELTASMQQTIHEMFQQRQQDSPTASNPPRGERLDWLGWTFQDSMVKE